MMSLKLIQIFIIIIIIIIIIKIRSQTVYADLCDILQIKSLLCMDQHT